jgi:hypothetical protein
MSTTVRYGMQRPDLLPTWWRLTGGFEGGHPVSFPAKAGEHYPVKAHAEATTEVHCPTCDAEPDAPCYWEPHRNIDPERVHRHRLKLITDIVV